MLSIIPSLLPFAMFAFVASITPGPTNILILAHSARYGSWSAVPIILGACLAAATIVLIVGCGLGGVMIAHPMLQSVMQWVGVVWLSYLAWQIYRSPIQLSGSSEVDSQGSHLNAWKAGALQLTNPKTWMMALAVAGVFAGSGDGRTARIVQLSIVFFLVSVPCLGVWALTGTVSRQLLHSKVAFQHMNRLLAVILVVATWYSVSI